MLTREQAEKRLFEAVEEGDNNRVKYLIGKGADVRVRNDEGKTPLHTNAVQMYYDTQITKSLIDAGASVDEKDNEGHTPLHLAARYGFKDTVEHLIAIGADVNAEDDYKGNPLHSTLSFSYNKNQLGIVEYLVKKGANVNKANMFGDTPLCEAANSQCPAGLAQCLINAGADVKAFSRGGTPLHTAVENLNFFATRYNDRYNGKNIIEILIEAGADINAANRNGKTPLHLAIYRNETFKSLIDKGADINARNSKNGESVLHTAVSHFCLDAVKYLIQKGTDLNALDRDGNTPLHIASKKKEHLTTYYLPHDIKRHDIELAKLLIANGVNVNIENNEGKTPLDIAREEGKTDIVDILRSQMEMQKREADKSPEPNSNLSKTSVEAGNKEKNSVNM